MTKKINTNESYNNLKFKMMSKNLKLIILTSLMATSLMANAQAKLKVGLGGGVNFSNFSGSDVNEAKSLMGYNGGLMTEIKFPIKLGVEADILFSKKGAGNIIFTDNQGNSIGSAEMKLTYIDIPVVAKIYFLKVVNLQLGAQYSFLLSANMNVMDGLDIKDQFNSGDLAAVLGFGVDVSVIHFSCRYNYGLASIDKSGADVKNNILTLTIGLWLKK